MGLIKSSDSIITSIGNDWKKSLFLIALFSSFFFIGLGHVRLFDWDEINFAESAREMIKSGDYLRVQINYSPFWEKPPFFFWLQVGAMKIFGINEFAARFPNALFGFIYLITFYFIGKHHYSGKFGLIWGLLFISSLLPYIYFKSGIIDPVFNYFIFLSIYFMLRAISVNTEENHLSTFALLSGLASGLSVVTKGPVGFLLLALTLFFYLLIKRFKPFPTIKKIALFFTGFIIIICGWLSIEVANNGFSVLQQFIAYQAELFNSGVAGHAQPFYYHFVVVFFGCFPISILALNQFWKKNPDSEPNDLRTWMLSLFWVVMILFSLSTTKIIHYSSMTYIPLSFLAALGLFKIIAEDNEIKKGFIALYSFVGILVGLIITAIPIIIYNKSALYPMMNDPFAVASLQYAVEWSGYEFLIGIFYLLLLGLSIYFLITKRVVPFIFFTTSNLTITLLLVLFFVLPKIEGFTQGPAIDFFISKQGKNCYVESFGYKSYAQYYYSDIPYSENQDRKRMDWLANGPIDKTVYLVSKITNNELDNHPNFKLIQTVGGFKMYVRNP